MLNVLNVSKRNLVIGGVLIAPMKSHDFEENTLNNSVKERINNLANLGLVKLSHKQLIIPNKKQTKKSK